jgi:hypothetical protein
MFILFCMRGCGCIERPAFPAPSAIGGRRPLHNSGAVRREIARAYLSALRRASPRPGRTSGGTGTRVTSPPPHPTRSGSRYRTPGRPPFGKQRLVRKRAASLMRRVLPARGGRASTLGATAACCRRENMSGYSNGSDRGAISYKSRNAAASGVADWLCLAAAPTFGMALLTGVLGGESPVALCSMADASPLSGMVPMYLLMSAFHSAPWLALISGRRRTILPSRPWATRCRQALLSRRHAQLSLTKM